MNLLPIVALVSIDPGLCTGWASWGYNGLLACDIGVRWPNASNVIIEKPQVYPSTGAKQANDLVTLAVQVGEYKEQCTQLGATVTLITPHAWKGTLKKEMHHPRVWAELTEREQAIVRKAGSSMAKSKIHNMMDAVGLGLFATCRLRPSHGHGQTGL